MWGKDARWKALLLAMALCGCSSGGGGGGGGSSVELPAAPASLEAVAAAGAVTLSWPAASGAEGYDLFWSLVPGVVPEAATRIADVSSPHLHLGLDAGRTYHYVVRARNAAGAGPTSPEASATVQVAGAVYDPPWAAAAPLRTLALEYDAQKSSAQNGEDLKAAVLALVAGDRLEIGAGTYVIDSLFRIDLVGTFADPIRIAAAAGETVVLTRSNATQNVVNVGASGPARYLALEGLEITGGDLALRLWDASDVWVDRCRLHHCGGVGIAANTHDAARLVLTRNEVHHTGGSGEGMYLGANGSATVVRDSVIALNHVHHTYGTQGEGIELKQGSFGNLIAENLVHDCSWPCIVVMGTDGNAFNVVERNVCYGSGDNVMQVQGEAVVRNNLLMDGVVGFGSHDHQGQSRDLVFVHNTIVNAGTGAVLSDWTGRPGMVFANNVVYSQGEALRFSGGAAGVDVAGNVVLGGVTGASTGWVNGTGLTDFEHVTWDAVHRDARPTALGALIGTGDLVWEEPLDLTGAPRVPALEAGSYDGP